MRQFDGAEPSERRLIPATLRGFRQWKLSFPSAQLGYRYPHIMSLNNTVWPDAQLTAMGCTIMASPRLSPHPDGAPLKRCSCGIYCLSIHADWQDGRYFSGVVACWGKIQFGTIGFRAQHARIEAIHLPPPESNRDWLLRETFKAQYSEVLVFADKEMMYRQYPEDDFSSLYSEEVQQQMAKERAQFVINQARRRFVVPNPYVGKIIDLP